MEDRLEKYLRFIREVERLKSVERTAWTTSGRRESTAEHSWRLALLAMVLCGEYPRLDRLRVLQLVLVHDLGETYDGDIPAVAQGDPAAKERVERAAVERLAGCLPEGAGRELRGVWEEYEACRTPEAKLVKALDKAEPDLLRFGMRIRMPAAYDRIDYYGRGPWENYADRKDGALVGRYRQTVDEQFYPYIRPQETGTKSDVRRWRQHDIAGRGVEITASEPFSASALHYAQEALDEGLTKQQGHSQEIEPDDAVWLCIDKAQYGLGCVDSWGRLPLRKYRLPYGNYEFEFKIRPL